MLKTATGRLHWWHAVAFTFVLPDGREIKSGESGSGRLRREFADIKEPVPVEVEYHPTRTMCHRAHCRSVAPPRTGPGFHRSVQVAERVVGRSAKREVLKENRRSGEERPRSTAPPNDDVTPVWV
jgi:hypothetical protein